MPGPMTTGGIDPAYMLPQVASPFGAGAGGVQNGVPNFVPGSGPGSAAAPFQNFIPAMQPANYNPGGGYMPTPLGGMWNQQAQQMAGPMFMPTTPGGQMQAPQSVLFGVPNAVMPTTPGAGNMAGAPKPIGAPTPVTMPSPVTMPIPVPNQQPPGFGLGGWASPMIGGGSAPMAPGMPRIARR